MYVSFFTSPLARGTVRQIEVAVVAAHRLAMFEELQKTVEGRLPLVGVLLPVIGACVKEDKPRPACFARPTLKQALQERIRPLFPRYRPSGYGAREIKAKVQIDVGGVVTGGDVRITPLTAVVDCVWQDPEALHHALHNVQTLGLQKII